MSAQPAAPLDFRFRCPTPGHASRGLPAPTVSATPPVPRAAAPDAERARTQAATAAALALAAAVALFAAMVVTLLLTASAATHLSDADSPDDPAAALAASVAAGH